MKVLSFRNLNDIEKVENTFSTLRTKRSKKGEMKREPNKKLDAVEKLILMYSVELCTRKKNEKILDQMFLTIFKEKFCPLKKDSLFTPKL